ncbi:MAG: hypothetical protein ACTSYW_00395 [Candidatus Heimdallarchaeota archaeon]
MATPGGIEKPLGIAAKELVELLRNAFNTIVQEAAQKADPLVNIPGLTQALKPGKEKDTFVGDSVHQSTFLTVKAGENTNVGRKIITQMDLPLQEDGKFGLSTDDILGAEEDLKAVFNVAYANDVAHAVSLQNFGINARELTPTGLAGNKALASAQKKLGTWLGEVKGRLFRESMVRRWSSNLTVAPISKSAVIHQNTLVCGVAAASQPTYHQTGATWELNVYNVLNALSTSTGSSKVTVPRLLEILPQLEDKYIQPISVAGAKVWIMYVHPDIFNDLHNPDTAKSFAAYFQSMANLGISDLYKNAFPYGSFMLSDRLIVVKDPKAPIVGITANTTHPYYFRQGRVDDRPGSETKQFYASLIFGLNSTVMHEPEAVTYREQHDIHGKYSSIALTGAVGFNNVSYDDDSAGATPYNEGSAIMLSEKKLT